MVITKNELMELFNSTAIDEKKDPCWDGYKQVGMKDKDGKEVPNCVPIDENLDYGDDIDETKKGLWANIHAKRKRGEKPAKPGDADYPTKKSWEKTVKASQKEAFTNTDLFSLIDEIVLLETGSPIINYVSLVDEQFFNETINEESLTDVVNEILQEYYDLTEDGLNEAEYKGRKVSLGKIMRGDVKKYKVHVKNDKGNVVKVNFGDPNMEIKRDDPKKRANFRKRHRCNNPGPRWKARYWACKTWSRTPVSKMLKK